MIRNDSLVGSVGSNGAEEIVLTSLRHCHHQPEPPIVGEMNPLIYTKF